MSNLKHLADLPLLKVWGETVKARRLEGERISFAIIELAPNAVVPEHRHPAEQLGLCISGTLRFTIDGETRDLGPGGTWRITSEKPHNVVAGPEGAVVIDVFTPTRADWDALPLVDPPTPPRWPAA
jgi:quercetin dioxygenase-like cupin family protein